MVLAMEKVKEEEKLDPQTAPTLEADVPPVKVDYKKPVQLIVRKFDPNEDPLSDVNKVGMVFTVNDDGSYKDDIVDALIVKVNAATLPDQRTTIVTVLLRNNFIITESSCCVRQEDYNMEIAIENCMKKVRARVQDYLAFMRCCATVSVDELIEFDKIAQENI